MMFSLENLAQKLRIFRNRAGLSQTTVAEKAGISRLAYGNIETGKTNPRTSTLEKIAIALGISLQELFSNSRPSLQIRFRAKKEVHERDKIISKILGHLKRFRGLETLLKDPVSISELPTCNPMNQQEIETLASTIRDKCQIPNDQPISDVDAVFERLGVLIFPIQYCSDQFFGLSIGPEASGPAIAVNTWERISVERWIFSAFHELGHILFHLGTFDINNQDEDYDQEKQADQFAGHLLLPNGALIRGLERNRGQISWEWLMAFKREFRVSAQTVIMRIGEAYSVDLPKLWMWYWSEWKRRDGRPHQRSEESNPLLATEIQSFSTEKSYLKSYEPKSLLSTEFSNRKLWSLLASAVKKELLTQDEAAEFLGTDDFFPQNGFQIS